MDVLRNDAVNRANLHSAVQALAQGVGGAFVFVFLLKSGLSVPMVLATLAAINAARFAMRPAVLPLGARLGLRRLLVLGALMEALIFPMLPFVHGAGLMLVAVVVVSSAGSVVYWTSYHAYFAALGDAEARGGQIGVREIATAAVGIIAPAIGGWSMATHGPAPTFWAAAVIQCFSVAPLIGAPDFPVQREAPGGFSAAIRSARLLAADGWFGSTFYYAWQIALFVSLGERFVGFGAALALAGLAGAAASLGLGRLIDLGHGRRATIAAYLLVSAAAVLKAAAVGSAALAVTANVVGAVTATMMAPALMTRVYNLAKASPCPLRFHIATEGGWDIGDGAGCLVAAGALSLGAPLSAAMLLSLPGAALACSMLLRAYAEDRRDAIVDPA